MIVRKWNRIFGDALTVVGGCFAFCVTLFVFQDLLRDTLLLGSIIQAYMRGV